MSELQPRSQSAITLIHLSSRYVQPNERVNQFGADMRGWGVPSRVFALL